MHLKELEYDYQNTFILLDKKGCTHKICLVVRYWQPFRIPLAVWHYLNSHDEMFVLSSELFLYTFECILVL